MAGKFFSTLRDLRAGSTLDDLDSAVAEVVAAVRATGKVGEIKLTIKVRPPKKSSGTYVTVEDDVVTKIPKHDRSDTIFWPLADNSLSRHDPSQIPLELSVVTSDGEVVGFDPATGQVQHAAQ